MDINQILIIIIVIIFAVLCVMAIYFGISYAKSKKQEKKMDTIFNPNNLVEEESLLNVMDKKDNLDFKKEKSEVNNNFVNEKIEVVQNITEELKEKEIKTNPFGVDLTKKLSNNDIDQSDKLNIYNNDNKFF